MAILYKDPRYEYTTQLSRWLKTTSDLLGMLEPFETGKDHVVVRRDKRGLFAVFTKGRATPTERYKLEVQHGCKVTTTFMPSRRRNKVK